MRRSPNKQQTTINILHYIARLLVVGSAKSCSQTLHSPLNRIKLILQIGHKSQDINMKKITNLWKGNLANTIRLYLIQLIKILIQIGLSSVQNCLKKQNNQQGTVLDYLDIKKWKFFDKRKQVLQKMYRNLSGFVSFLISYPLLFVGIKIAAQVQPLNKQSLSIIQCFNNCYLQGGISKFYTGLYLHIIQQLLNYNINSKFEQAIHRIFVKQQKQQNKLHLFLLSEFVHAIVSIILFPLDTLIKNMIAKEIKIQDCINQIYQQKGIKGFYNGISFQILLSIFQTIILIIYDKLVSKKLQPKRSTQRKYPQHR